MLTPITKKYTLLLSEKLGIKPELFKFKRVNSYTKIWEEINENNYRKPHDYGQGSSYSVVCNTPNNDTPLGIELASFKLYEMPHCCAILVSCNAFVNHKYRGKGIGRIMNQFRQELATLLGYSLILCTDIEQNTCQRKLLAKENWKDVYSVVNKRTKNKVFISVKEI